MSPPVIVKLSIAVLSQPLTLVKPQDCDGTIVSQVGPFTNVPLLPLDVWS